ncbi:MAG TPA: RNA methyltransferase [Kiritimatiellia bacterium]|nr:RNA methyltransferase [Kiritimatiellia bacterium]
MGKPRWEYIYGINPAFEVIRGGRRKVHEAFLSESSRNNPRLKKLEGLLASRQIPTHWVEKGRVLDLSESKDNQGVVLRTEPYPYVASSTLFDRPRLLLLDNVEDPHNTGAILRCADVFGYDAVLLPEKGVPEIYPSVVKVSAGATEHLDIARDHNAVKHMIEARKAGYTVVALDAKGKTSLPDAARLCTGKFLLVIGGENRAVSQYILNEADIIIGIHQYGKINSLNASVAAGIAMHALRGEDPSGPCATIKDAEN